MLNVFVSSTSEDLESYRAATRDVILDLDWHPVIMEHFGNDPRPTVEACLARVAECEVVVFIQAFRRGWVPAVDQDGNGKDSITALELHEADRLKKPVLVFLADKDSWPVGLSDDDSAARAWLTDFRNKLNRMAVFFGHEDPPLRSFRAAMKEALAEHLRRVLEEKSGTSGPYRNSAAQAQAEIHLRTAPPVPLPEDPYPLLGPYTSPRTFAGRERELDELRRRLRLDPLIVCVHAPSGAGKSSLLLAGLEPRLAREGVLVSIERKPAEPGLARRLVGDLLELPAGIDISDAAPTEFAEWILRARELAGTAPVVVLDQLEDVLRDPRTRDQALTRLGPLLAATAQRVPGFRDPVCRWVLAYRHEYHGEVQEWLGDVLAEARRANLPGLETLPHNLSAEAGHSHGWPLPLFGKPAPGKETGEEAGRAFLEAILAPLAIEEPIGTPKYRMRFAAGAAERLARAFGAARRKHPEAPLVPELQVVLAHLIQLAERTPDGTRVIEVPESESELEKTIDSALDDHLQRALKESFPAGRDADSARRGRTRALLALRELADAQGRRGEGLPEATLLGMLGEGGKDVLEKLASPRMRLILQEDQDGVFVYVLSHDRMAEVVSRFVEDENLRRDLDLDAELIAMRRLVRMRAELYIHSSDRTQLDLGSEQFQRIEQSESTLILDEDRRRWWDGCRRRRAEKQNEGRRSAIVTVAAVVLVTAVVGIGIHVITQRIQLEKDLGLLRSDLPGTAFRSAIRLQAEHGRDPWEELETAGHEDGGWLKTFLIEGPWEGKGLPPVERGKVLDLVERVPSNLLESRELFGALIGAVDEVAVRETSLRPRALSLRDSLRARFAAINNLKLWSAGEVDSLNKWIQIRRGTFMMGSTTCNQDSSECPAHNVSVDSFFIQEHELTNAEYRRFDRHHDPEGADSLPVANVSWYEALAYSAWLNGNLPTEAQWEFAARGPGEKPREYPWGPARPTPERANLRDFEVMKVKSYERGVTPDSVYDMAGNAWEWCRDWYGRYVMKEEANPVGPATGDRRVLRGGSFFGDPYNLRGAVRVGLPPELRNSGVGFRCVVSASGGQVP